MEPELELRVAVVEAHAIRRQASFYVVDAGTFPVEHTEANPDAVEHGAHSVKEVSLGHPVVVLTTVQLEVDVVSDQRHLGSAFLIRFDGARGLGDIHFVRGPLVANRAVDPLVPVDCLDEVIHARRDNNVFGDLGTHVSVSVPFHLDFFVGIRILLPIVKTGVLYLFYAAHHHRDFQGIAAVERACAVVFRLDDRLGISEYDLQDRLGLSLLHQ